MQLFAANTILLLGDLSDLLPVIFLILYGIFQAVASLMGDKNKKAPPKQRPRRPVNAPGQEAAPADAPPNQADALRREVEEFLRRAQGKPPQEEKPVPLTPVAEKQPKQRRQTLEQRKPQPGLRNEGVAEHVARHVRSTAIAEHAESLGSELGQTDERLESRLQDRFDHQVGRLQHEEKKAAKDAAQPDIAAQIAEMLSKPEGMRQLIIAQEILQRPNRW